jgi:hypothetical protein
VEQAVARLRQTPRAANRAHAHQDACSPAAAAAGWAAEGWVAGVTAVTGLVAESNVQAAGVKSDALIHRMRY